MIELNDPDALDRAFVDSRKAAREGVPVKADDLLTKRYLKNNEAVELIRRYNEIFHPKIKETIRCGGTLRRLQQKLTEYSV